MEALSSVLTLLGLADQAEIIKDHKGLPPPPVLAISAQHFRQQHLQMQEELLRQKQEQQRQQQQQQQAQKREEQKQRRDQRAPACGAETSPRPSDALAALRAQCVERSAEVGEEASRVKLVVFDLDETLTLMSFMIEERDPPRIQREIVKVNFESPWVEGRRIPKLQSMLSDLATSESGEPRALAVLTRNGAGAEAVLRLLKAAGLADHFDAIWTMPWRDAKPNGVHRQGGDWQAFDPPRQEVGAHKADILAAVVREPAAWLPQLASSREDSQQDLLHLRPESVVLVDDQGANFQSLTSGAKVLRYCRVARYDAVYRNMGLVKHMGGIGAHSDEDYEVLRRFVENPSAYKERGPALVA